LRAWILEDEEHRMAKGRGGHEPRHMSTFNRTPQTCTPRTEPRLYDVIKPIFPPFKYILIRPRSQQVERSLRKGRELGEKA
jgi:hypothetical protein